jgi:hypothetical protein
MMVNNPELLSQTIYYQLADIFEISAIYYHEGRLILRARARYDRGEALTLLDRRLKAAGFTASVKEEGNEFLIGIKEKSRRTIPYLNIILFIATLITMFFSPAILSWSFDYFRHPGAIAAQVEFTIALMAILLFHEFGHYLAGRRRGVLMSLPYFLPAPNMIGTFGAVIKSRSPFTNRRDLIEVGATGPIAGFIVSIIALSIGLYNSTIVPIGAEGGFQLGDSLLLRGLAYLLIGPLPEGYDFMLAPAAFAGWVGLLVTMINLLPLGQLDGGHIIYGLFGKFQHYVGQVFLIAVIILGFWWPGWWIFGALAFLFGLKHPPTFNDYIKPSRTARLLGYAAIIIFIVSFVPVPFIIP